jgi:protocatechuate 3,4-dioxygenase beta subunit
MTEGPYYIDGEEFRRNITEGRPGAPLTLHPAGRERLATCRPSKGAVVDIWHADSSGLYSGF